MPCELDRSCTCRTTPALQPCKPRDGVCYAIWETRNRAAARDEYHAALRAAAQEATRENAQDVPARLQRIGVPTNVILGMLRVGENPSGAGLAWQRATEYTRDFGGLAKWLAFFGPTGVGKSTAACRVLWEWCKRIPDNSRPTGSAEPLVWLQASKLTGISTWHPDHTRWCEDMQRAVVLVVDDLGDEGTEQGRGALVDLLLARDGGQKRTVLTSNLLPQPFGERYGEALRDRIRSGGIVEVFPPKTPSFREQDRRKWAARTGAVSPAR